MEWSSLWSTSSLAFVIDRLCNEDYSNSWKWSLLVTWSWVAPNISVMEQDDILEMQRNSIISLPQLLLYFPIILNIWSHPFMLVPHVRLWCLLTGMPSVLFGFHPIGHFSFLECSKFPWSHSLPRCYFPCLKFVLHLNPGLRRFNLWTSTQLLLWKAFPDTQVLVRQEAPR